VKLLVTLFGLLLIIEGLPYAASPQSMRNWLLQVSQLKPELLRSLGVIAMAAGFLLCYLTQRTSLFG
jgi:uncharacterized protein